MIYFQMKGGTMRKMEFRTSHRELTADVGGNVATTDNRVDRSW